MREQRMFILDVLLLSHHHKESPFSREYAWIVVDLVSSLVLCSRKQNLYSFGDWRKDLNRHRRDDYTP